MSTQIAIIRVHYLVTQHHMKSVPSKYGDSLPVVSTTNLLHVVIEKHHSPSAKQLYLLAARRTYMMSQPNAMIIKEIESPIVKSLLTLLYLAITKGRFVVVSRNPNAQSLKRTMSVRNWFCGTSAQRENIMNRCLAPRIEPF
eukprot:PhF_6_TR1924/c1_g2_i1/m.2974